MAIVVTTSAREDPFMSADDEMLTYMETVPVPDLGETPFLRPAPLSQSRVAIVTTAGLGAPGDDDFGWYDPSFRVLPSAERDLGMSHHSPNFDRMGIVADLNVVYPADRLQEMAYAGLIGSIAPNHVSFMGAQRDMDALVHDSARVAAALLKEQGTDVVVLTPV
jgi:D-proline reductase (dithiol) PrdB